MKRDDFASAQLPVDAPIRPRVASVVGVVWLYLGSQWTVSGMLGVLGYTWMGKVAGQAGGASADVPMFLLVFPAALFVLGAAGLRSAFGVLQLELSAAAMLRRLNWAAMGLIAWFGYHWVSQVVRPLSRYSSYVSYEQMKMAVLGIVVLSLMCVPFWLMARKLGPLLSQLEAGQSHR